jgi:putative phosphoribosyl transferase
MAFFRDRYEAGRALATKLLAYANRPDVVVLGLPRGGVPVAFEVAQALRAPLDVYVVRKLGVPGNEELAMGAVASGGVVVVNSEVVDALGISEDVIVAAARVEMAEIVRRERLYRNGRPAPELTGRTVILVDDGVATGSTMVAAAAALRRRGPKSVVIATPVVAAPTVRALEAAADEVVYLDAPESFVAVGQWYLDFTPTTDDEVRELLAGHATRERPREPASVRSVSIPAGRATLSADLVVPGEPQGIVLFSHGAGSSRKSPRNQFVAEVLEKAGFATLLLDLLTEGEEASEQSTGHLRFDIGLLARRLGEATDWVKREPATAGLSIGYFGASTGAAAALVAAAERNRDIGAIVSRGGRPDLAGPALALVRAPTLLIVGGNDPEVLELNREALRLLRTQKRLEVVPGASHLFEEPGALERVAELAAEWFEDHLAVAGSQADLPRSHRVDEGSTGRPGAGRHRSW